ncbi:hypothetical protein H8E07_06270 [bacterium]|nr:hypothetical protein [bacterium]
MNERAARNTWYAERPLLVVWIALSLLHLLPIVAAEHLPMQDLPNHLAIIGTLAAEDEVPGWNERFVNRLSPEPYITYYGAGVLLSKLVGAVAANRLLMALYVLLLPLSFAALYDALGGTNRWGALFGFLLIYNDPYLVGFTNYLLCLPMVLLGATLAVRLAGRATGGAATGAVLALMAVLIYFTHPFGLAPLAVLAVVCATGRATRPRRVAYVAAALVPSLVLLAVWWFGGSGVEGVIRLPAAFKLEYLLRTPVLLLENPDDKALQAASILGLALLVAAIVAWRRAPGDGGPGGLARIHPGWWATAVFLAAYFAAPFASGATIWLDLRLALFAWVALLLAAGGWLTRGRSGKALAVALCLVSILGVGRLHRAFDREIAPLFEVIAEMEPNRRVLPILCDPRSEAIEPFYVRNGLIPFSSPYAHFGSHYHVRKGGESPWMTFHADLAWIPLGLRDPLYSQHFGIDGPFAPGPVLGTVPAVRDDFDYLLVRGGDAATQRYLARYGTRRARAGAFTLYEIRR